MANPFVIAGLGNPGTKYSETRHNAGFWFLDELAAEGSVTLKRNNRLKAELAVTSLHGQECLLLRPTTWMNDSGQAVRAVLDYYRVGTDRLLVAYDELDLPPGTSRLKAGGGHGGHNGMRDIFRHTGKQDFLRLRIGIGHPGHRDAVTSYVLSRPNRDDELSIRRSISDALAAMPLLLAGDVPGAQKQLHTVKD